MGEAVPFKVMVVEDDDEVARAVARKLGSDGFTSRGLQRSACPSSRGSTPALAPWDVVILDVGLPGMSGLEVLQRFREAGSLAAVIMLTGDQHRDHRDRRACAPARSTT